MLERIVEDAVRAFGCARSAVLLADEEAGGATIAAARGWTRGVHVEDDRFEVTGGVIGRVARGRVPGEADRRSPPVGEAGHEGLRGACPLAVGLAFSNAGHLLPVLADEIGGQAVGLAPEFPLGIREGSDSSHEVALPPRSRLLPMLGGAIEAPSGSSAECGVARMLPHAAMLRASPASLQDHVRAHAGENLLAGDITIVALEALA